MRTTVGRGQGRLPDHSCPAAVAGEESVDAPVMITCE